MITNHSYVIVCYSLFTISIAEMLMTSCFAQSQKITLSIEVKNLPPTQVAENDIYVAGSFNNWHPGRADYRMQKIENGTYFLEIDSLTEGEEIAYKFTRGSWEKVERDSVGKDIPNRLLTVHHQAITYHTIANWENMTDPQTVGHVQVLNAAYFMPQLNRTRRVWAYLPPDYFLGKQRYPIIYLQDGQNLFDNTLAFSGEWGIDDTMESLFAGGDPGAIVIGIENGGQDRLNEYSPWKHPTHGGGEGDAYMEFIVKTLKPHVDSVFRTKSDRENTAIGGSSMGGLISMYGGIKYQAVFSKLFIFSPSFWFSQAAFQQVAETKRQFPMKIMLLGGTPEGNGSVVKDMQKMYETLLQNGFSKEEVKLVEKTDGQHSEWFWRREYPDAYKWMFDSHAVATHYHPNDNLPFSLLPTPFTDNLTIMWKKPQGLYGLALFNSFGQNVLHSQYIEPNAVIDTKKLPKGVYLLIIETEGNTYRKKILKE